MNDWSKSDQDMQYDEIKSEGLESCKDQCSVYRAESILQPLLKAAAMLTQCSGVSPNEVDMTDIDPALDSALGFVWDSSASMEIFIGILGNMLYFEGPAQLILARASLIDRLCSLIYTEDIPVLIQLTRLLAAGLAQRSPLPVVQLVQDPDWLLQISRILRNTLNDQLLTNCLVLLDRLLRSSQGPVVLPGRVFFQALNDSMVTLSETKPAELHNVCPLLRSLSENSALKQVLIQNSEFLLNFLSFVPLVYGDEEDSLYENIHSFEDLVFSLHELTTACPDIIQVAVYQEDPASLLQLIERMMRGILLSTCSQNYELLLVAFKKKGDPDPCPVDDVVPPQLQNLTLLLLHLCSDLIPVCRLVSSSDTLPSQSTIRLLTVLPPPNYSHVSSRWLLVGSSCDWPTRAELLLFTREQFFDDDAGSCSLLQAVVFIEDGLAHRSIYHRVDKTSLHRYRFYYSPPIQWALFFFVFLDLLLVFVEWPSSLSSSSDPSLRRVIWEAPCGMIEVFELVCLVVFSLDVLFHIYVIGHSLRNSKWLIAAIIVLFVSFVDVLVSLSCHCHQRIRVRQLLRPFFLIQRSSLMKKTLHGIQKMLIEVLSVIFFFVIHLFFFTMFGMLLFSSSNPTNSTLVSQAIGVVEEKQDYFSDITEALTNLFVLITTANYPDVMMPAYKSHRLYVIFFSLCIIIGTYLFMNLLTAVVYKHFSGNFSNSMQASYLRRRVGVQAAYEVLLAISANPVPRQGIDKCSVHQLIEMARLPKKTLYLPLILEELSSLQSDIVSNKDFHALFDVLYQASIKKRPVIIFQTMQILLFFQKLILHPYFQYFGDLVTFINVSVLMLEFSESIGRKRSTQSLHAMVSFSFTLYYIVEQCLMIWATGWRRFLSHKHILFDAAITLLLLSLHLLLISMYGVSVVPGDRDHLGSSSGLFSAWNIYRMTSMLVIIRLLRVIPNIRPLTILYRTITDLVVCMRPFLGIIVCAYYVFAVLGVMIFEGRAPSRNDLNYNTTKQQCGSYQQLDYFPNNFNDFAAACVLLWELMVVNNWHVFLAAFSETTSKFSRIYFLVWYFVSVVICLNLLVATILEAFVSQHKYHQQSLKRRKFSVNEESHHRFSMAEMFRANRKEPTAAELRVLLLKHPFLKHKMNSYSSIS